MTLTAADIEIIREAAAMLDGEAMAMRQSHCRPPDHTDWTGDPIAKQAHDEMVALVGKLYDVAERMEKGAA